MDVRNSSKKSDGVKAVVADKSTPPYNYGVNPVRSLVDARIIYTGIVTGRSYEWPKAGSVVPVDERDVPDLLAKRVGVQGCCGAQDGNKVFELI